MPQDPEHSDGLPAYAPLNDVDIEDKHVDIEFEGKEDYANQEEYKEEELHEQDVEMCDFDQVDIVPESKGLLVGESRFHAVLQKASPYLSILLPSFLKPKDGPPKKLHSTAWLGTVPPKRDAIEPLRGHDN